MSSPKKKEASTPKKQLKMDAFLSKSKDSANHSKSKENVSKNKENASKSKENEKSQPQKEESRSLRSPRKRTRDTSKTSSSRVENNNNNNNNISTSKRTTTNNNNNNNNNEKPVTPEKKPPVRSKKSAAKPEVTVVAEQPPAKKSKLLPEIELKIKNKAGSQKGTGATDGKKMKREKQEDGMTESEENAVAVAKGGGKQKPPPPESRIDGSEVVMRIEPGQILVCDTLDKATSGASDGDFIVPHPVEKIIDAYPDAEFIGPDNDQDKEYTELESMQDSSVLSDATVGDSSTSKYTDLETMQDSPSTSKEGSLNPGEPGRPIQLDAKVIRVLPDSDNFSVASDTASGYNGDDGRPIPLETKVYEPGKKTNFKCKVCDQDFPNRYFQRKHMLMEHENQLYECRICSFTSVNPEKLKSHIIKQHVIKKERSETISVDEVQVDLDELMTKQTPRKVMMEDGVALGRDAITKMHFLCAMCDRVYTSKYSLERHVRCHTREKPYSCEVCNFSTSYREHMRRHMTNVHLIVHSNEPKVKYVPKSRRKTEEKNVSTEDDDMEMEDDEEKVKKGSDVDKTEGSDIDEAEGSDIDKTEEGSGTDKTEGSEVDVTTVDGDSELNESEEQEQESEQNQSTNQEQDEVESVGGSSGITDTSSFTTASSLSTAEDGKKKRRNILRNRFECAACGMKGTHKADLVNHIKEKHPNAHIESLDNGDGSKVHLIVTVSKKPSVSRRMVITCPDCSKVFHDTWKYKVHRRSHTGVKPFGCSVCAFYATSKMTIRDHIHRKHKDFNNPKILLRTVLIDGTVDHVELSMPVREFKCDICEETFNDNYHLKQHKKTNHTEALPFSCVECGHREWARASIIIHCINTHREKDIEGLVLRNNKPFTVGPIKLPTCQQCDKIFPYQSQLYIHQKQHTGERSFFCDICSYRTNLKSSLEKHIMKHLEPEPAKKSGSKRKEKADAAQDEQPINFVNVEESSSPAKKPKQRKQKVKNETKAEVKNETKAEAVSNAAVLGKKEKVANK